MRKYFCDICGREIPEPIPKMHEDCPIMTMCQDVSEVCPDCYKAGQKIRPQEVLLSTWRQAASASNGTMPRPAITKMASNGECTTIQMTGEASKGTVTKLDSSISRTPTAPEGISYAARAPEGYAFTGSLSGGKESPQPKAIAGNQGKKSAGTSMGHGEHWSIKRETHRMLKDYREKNGLGCLDALSKKSGVSVDILRSMLDAKPNPINTWLMVRDAITALEKAEKKGP